MHAFLRQSTASQSRIVGPFVDDTDFKTAETGLTIANTDVKLCANGAASVNKNSGGGTHRVNGMYSLTFDATDTATVGELAVSISVSGALLVTAKFTVLEEAVYDALYAASAPGYLQSTTAGRTLDVSATGEAGIDWANVGSPTTSVSLSGTTISTSQAVASVSGAVGSVTGAVGSVTGNVGGNVVGSVASVTGAVGSVTGNVGGNVTGSVGSVLGGINTSGGTITTLDALDTAQDTQHAATLSAIATAQADLDVLTGTDGVTLATSQPNYAPATAAALATAQSDLDVITGADGVTLAASQPNYTPSTHSAADVWSVGSRTLTANTNLNDPTAAAIADAVWDEALSGHLTAGTTGNALNAAGAAGDPWSTSLPGAYGAGSAGYIVGTYLDAAISSLNDISAADVWASGTRTLSAATNITSTGGTITVNSGGVTLANGVTHGGSSAMLRLGSSTSTPALYVTNTDSGDNSHAVYFAAGAAFAGGAGLMIDGGGYSTMLGSAGSAGLYLTGGATLATASSLATVDTVVDAIKLVTDNLPDSGALTSLAQAADLTALAGEIGTAGDGLSAIPWNAAWDAEVQSECADALTAFDPATATALASAFTEIKGATWSASTDTLEAIRDRGDAAWITATSVTVSDKTGFSLASDGLAAVTAWTVDVTGSLSGTVGSVTGNVGGNVVGSVGSLATQAKADVNAEVDTAISDAGLTASGIADAVWDEALSGHLTAGSTGNALNAAGSAGDPWATSLPGAYGAGSAGYIVGTYLDAAISGLNDIAAADVWAVGTRTLTAATNITSTGGTITVTSGGVTLADGVTHGGTSAMLRLGSSSSTPALYVTNSHADFNSHAVLFKQTSLSGGLGMLIDGGGATTIMLDAGEEGLSTGGGSFASLTSQLVTVDTVVDAIKAVTDNLPDSGALTSLAQDSDLTALAGEVGTAGDGLTSIPWNAAWDAEVQSECADALSAYGAATSVGVAAAFTEIKGATWSAATDTLEALRDRGDSAWVTATSVTVSDKTGFSLASTGLDLVTTWTVDVTGSLSGSVGSVTGSVGSVAAGGITAASIATGAIDADAVATDAVTELAAGVWNSVLSGFVTAGTAGKALDDLGTALAAAQASLDVLTDTGVTCVALSSAAITDVWSTDVLAESYAAKGAAPTPAQALYVLMQHMQESTIVGTTKTVRKLDGTTTAGTYTLDSATKPTSITRAT